MTRTEFADLIRENTAVPRVDVRPLRGPMCAIAAGLFLLALLLLPVAILAVDALYQHYRVSQMIENISTQMKKAPGFPEAPSEPFRRSR